jgi:quercetin dioxygenase-like cupin family protein
MAKDAAAVVPNVYTVLFENERVRLVEARLKPGDSSALHSHPDYLVYNLEDGRVKFSGPSGDHLGMRRGQDNLASGCGQRLRGFCPLGSS